jgi:ferritin-like metal-binding protein YciE
MDMKELKNLYDLLCHEIQALYSAEKLIFAGMTRMIKKTYNLELKAAFQQHLEETSLHIERLERCAQILDIDSDGDGNPAVKGLIAEGEKVMHKDVIPETLDAALLAGAQKIEHYEISGYGTAAYYALELGLIDVAILLNETLEEEKATDLKLNNLAKLKINRKIEGVVK